MEGRWQSFPFVGARFELNHSTAAGQLTRNTEATGRDGTGRERGEAAGTDAVVTQKPKGVKGFQPTARWAVER